MNITSAVHSKVLAHPCLGPQGDSLAFYHSGEKNFNVKTSQFASFGAEWDWDQDRKLKAGRLLNPLPYHSPSRSCAGAAVGLASGTCLSAVGVKPQSGQHQVGWTLYSPNLWQLGNSWSRAGQDTKSLGTGALGHWE